jgi:hypothetical protein
MSVIRHKFILSAALLCIASGSSIAQPLPGNFWGVTIGQSTKNEVKVFAQLKNARLQPEQLNDNYPASGITRLRYKGNFDGRANTDLVFDFTNNQDSSANIAYGGYAVFEREKDEELADLIYEYFQKFFLKYGGDYHKPEELYLTRQDILKWIGEKPFLRIDWDKGGGYTREIFFRKLPNRKTVSIGYHNIDINEVMALSTSATPLGSPDKKALEARLTVAGTDY